MEADQHYPPDKEVEGMDEGWWSSLLSDESQMRDSHHESKALQSDFEAEGNINWVRAQQLYRGDCIVPMFVQGFNRGGLLVSGEEISGFLPISHLIEVPKSPSESDRKVMLSRYSGKTLKLKIIECDPSQERIVFSERAARMGEGRRNELLLTLKPGTEIVGVVTNITDFGAFIDLGGVEGLIHVSEISWGRVQHPRELLKIGQQVNVLILQVAEECSRIALSLKRLTPNPWETLDERIKPGDTVQAVITAISRFGAFARLEEGVEGLIHVSSLTGNYGSNSIYDLVKVGEEVMVKILHIDIAKRRLGLELVP